MNRYALWKYLVILSALILGIVYALPNFYGEAPAIQISSTKPAAKLNQDIQVQLEKAFTNSQLIVQNIIQENNSLVFLFQNSDDQLKAKFLAEKYLTEQKLQQNYVVALNLIPRSPQILRAIRANPMYLGLDLRGGMHFVLQVDVNASVTQKLDSIVSDFKTHLREKNIRHGGVSRMGMSVQVRPYATQSINDISTALQSQYPDLQYTLDQAIHVTLKPESIVSLKKLALQQNITTLHNRINELGVTEPVIQQQGLERIVIQLPGVQDSAKAKDIIGRTATLELRMVDESVAGLAAERGQQEVPFGSERYLDRNGQAYIVKKDPILSGGNLTDAQPGFDGVTNEVAVHLTLDAKGSRIFAQVTRDNINKRIAILLFEKGQGEVVTAPVIRSEINGGKVQITGNMSTEEANLVALLLRAGSLAAPMEIIEERTIGPSLGAENIKKGFQSVLWGFVAVAGFMMLYYLLFGLFSSLALAFNLLLLVSVLSGLQATLTLPGMAAIALVIGMAIDSNVLINERIREELRLGQSPQMAIYNGFDRAWGTILDSNITTLIAGVALYAFGSGPIKGFAVVHCLGILTSMFSAVFFARGVVNFWYGRQKKLSTISIGTIWKPNTTTKQQDL
ncbi:MAG: protein translocase subunit SecD [Gammaproteobacteria bacterium]|nr:protein translocase subunit SecD [Gammaproteobacteria bacterium]